MLPPIGFDCVSRPEGIALPVAAGSEAGIASTAGPSPRPALALAAPGALPAPPPPPAPWRPALAP